MFKWRKWKSCLTLPPTHPPHPRLPRLTGMLPPPHWPTNVAADRRTHTEGPRTGFWHIFAHRCRTDRRRCALCAPIQPFIHRYSAPTTAARGAFPDRFRTEINTFINICVIIHPFAQHRSGLTRTRLRMTYCCCSRTSLHLNIVEGGESNRRGGQRKKDFASSHTCSFTRNPTAKSPYEQLTRWNRLKTIKTQTSLCNLCAIWRGTAGYLTGDRRLRFRGLHVQIHQSSTDDQVHSFMITFVSLSLFLSFFFFPLCVCLYSGHPQRTGSQPIFVQRIPSINLDMSLSCLASLNSSVVSQFNAEAPLHPTPLKKRKKSWDVTHLFSVDAFLKCPICAF